MQKTYYSRHFLHLNISIRLDGKHKTIEFTGGYEYPRRVNGSFTTANPRIQEALEAHPKFGTRFILQSMEVPSAAEEVKEHKVILSEAKNALEAKTELNRKYKVPWSMLKNSTMVKSVASELGIQYPDWP